MDVCDPDRRAWTATDRSDASDGAEAQGLEDRWRDRRRSGRPFDHRKHDRGEDDPAESEAVLTTSTAIPLATSAPARTAESSSVVAAPSSGALAPTVADASGLSDARCASASPSLIAQIARGLTDNSLTLANGLVIEDGPYTFVGATMLRPDGQMENRSDVWVVLGGKVYASTGGARNETSWPKASSNIDISPGDERVQALDQCVIDVTTH